MRELAMIDTDAFSASMRERGVDAERRLVRVTRFTGTDQEKDLTVPANAGGFGRVRHFRRRGSGNAPWPANPLPMDPAAHALGLPATDALRAQVFQNAVCNWRCWYCFVDFDLLAGNPKFSGWASASDLVGMYLDQPDPPRMIDLTGGQPDLTPEWVPWMMDALDERGLSDSVYLWSDDNLSNDYFWRFLSDRQRERVASYGRYGRACCFKGFDAESFSFNTRADPALFDRQFDLFRRLLSTGMDLYAYATFTAPSDAGVGDAMARFVDRLQSVHPNLPLRTVPLEITAFTPMEGRLEAVHRGAMLNQYRAIDAWERELRSRFGDAERAVPIHLVPFRPGGGKAGGRGISA